MAATRSTNASAPADIDAPAYVVFGSEEFLKNQAIRKLLARLLAPEYRAMCLSEYEGESAALAEVLDEVRTLPFLAPRRVVIVRDADTFITQNRQHLEDYLASPCPTGTLILECRSFRRDTRLYRKLSSWNGCIPCEAPKAYTLPSWLAQRARAEHGKQLDPDTARRMVDYVGNSLAMLDGELSKLALYVGSRPAITVEDVEALVGQNREQKVFGILRAMSEGDPGGALRLWEEVLQTDRAAEARAIGGIAYGVRQLLAAHEEVGRGASMFELCKRFYTNEQELRRQLRAFPPARLHGLLCDLCEADLASKTGASTVRSAIERLIIHHTVPVRC